MASQVESEKCFDIVGLVSISVAFVALSVWKKPIQRLNLRKTMFHVYRSDPAKRINKTIVITRSIGMDGA